MREFPPEARRALDVMRDSFREKLESNTSPQFGVGCLIDVAHSAGTKVCGDRVVRQLATHHAGTVPVEPSPLPGFLN
jgi:hypothetical protein